MTPTAGSRRGPTSPYGQQPTWGTSQPVGDKRPGTVTAAGWITIVFSGLAFLLLGLGVLVFLVARDDFVREIQDVPEFQSSGIDPDTAVGAVIAILGFLMLWALIALVLAVFVLRRSNVARILLVISSAVTALFSLLGLSGGGGSAPTLLAAVAVIVLLFVGGAGDWFNHVQTPTGGGHPGATYGQAPYGQAPYGTQPDPNSQATYPSFDNPYGQQPPGSDNRLRPAAARLGQPLRPAARGGRQRLPAEGLPRALTGVSAPGLRRPGEYALGDDVRLLAERPPHELAARLRVVVEALRRDRNHPGPLGERERELATVGPAEVGGCRWWRSRCPAGTRGASPAAARPSHSRSRRDLQVAGQQLRSSRARGRGRGRRPAAAESRR